MELYLFDKNKEVIDIIPPEDLAAYVQEMELNKWITSEVAGNYRDSLEQAHFYGSQDVDDRSIFWRYKIDDYNKEKKDFHLKGTYELFDDLKARKIIIDKRPTNATAYSALETILEGTGWQVGQVQTNNISTTNWYYEKPLSAFWDFLDKWRVEFKPRMVFSKGKVTAKYIDIYNKLSDDYGKWYEYSDKLLNVVAEERRSDVYTAFYGRGKGEESGDGYGRRITFEEIEWKKSKGDPLDKPKGEQFIEFPDATAEYGYEDGTPRYDVIEIDSIEEPELLIQATYEYGLNEIRPKSHFRTIVHEDGLAELGEIVTMIHDEIGIRYKTRIFIIRRNFLNKDIKEIDFGDKLVKTRAENTKKAADDFKKQEQEVYEWLNHIRDSVINDYFNDNGYDYDLKVGNKYDLPAGRYSFDAPIDEDPTKVVYLGAGKLLIANSKLPNGEWEWRTAIDADGMNADELNVGKIRSSLIQIGNDSSFDLGYDPSKKETPEGAKEKADAAETNAKKEAEKYTKEELEKLGELAWKSKIEKAMLGQTIISGGYIRTDLLSVNDLYAISAQIANWKLGNNIYSERNGLFTTLKSGGSVALAAGSPSANDTSGALFQLYHNGKLVSLHGSSGDRTEMDSSGFHRYVGGSKREYHHLMHVATFTYGESSSSARWITLPKEFRNKDFKIYFAIADSTNIGSYRKSIQRFVCTRHPDHKVDYKNARVPVIAYKSETTMDGSSPSITKVQGLLLAIY